MAVRRCLTLILSIGLTLWAQFESVEAERWSRQVSNSEWIPLADPRTTQSGQSQVGQNGVVQGLVPAGASHLTQVQPLTLPPVLQQQYQQQLQQLQKTQESIQNLLMLQQQLRAQQQILQAQAFLPNDFNSPEEDKQALHRSTIANLQAVSDLAPEVLVPPLPSPDAIPPIYQAQNFFPQNPSQFRENAKQSQALKETQNVDSSASDRDQDYKDARGEINQRGQSRDDIAESNSPGKQRDFTTRQGGHYKNSKQFREQANQENVESHSTPSSVDSDENGEEEVQLVYVPAETLAQRGQQKTQKVRGRKAYLQQQQQQQYLPNHQQAPEIQSTPLPPVQQIFANQLLQQLQRDQEEKDQVLRDQRLKELARLDEEQKELERQAKLHQEAVIRELELQRQREEEKEKELARLEEAAKHRELERLRELREKQRVEEELARQVEAQKQEELERQKIAEIQAKEERQRQDEVRRAELDRLAALEKQRELQLQDPAEKKRKLERQRQRAEEAAVRATAHLDLKSQWKAESEEVARNQNQARAEALVQNQQQHHTEVTRNRGNRVRGRQRQKNQQAQQNYQSVSTTTPSPNQPPLSVYMGTVHADPRSVKVSDVLRILKDAKTISVLDSVETNAPQIFVGPTNLDPPLGYAKFDLPYLSSIDNNRVERRVDKLPFFVAPLSFDPPPGYSKIPFPAPHIGSVVVNTVDNLIDPQDVTEGPSPSPTPLIEPNSYIESNQQSTPNAYEPRSTTSAFSQESSGSTPNYNTDFSTTGSSGTRYRYKQFHVDDRGATQTQPVSSTTAVPYQEERSSGTIRTKQRSFYDDNSAATTPSYYTTHNIASTPYYQESFASSTPNYQSNRNEGTQEEPTKEQDLAAQLALINRELAQHRYNDPAQQRPTATAASHLTNSFHDVDHASILAKLAANEQRSNLEEQNWRQHTQDISSTVGGPGRVTVGPTQYSFPAELPPISPQLPGLVNSLLEETDPVLPATTPVPTTTTTTTIKTTSTTTEVPTSTFRIRGRHRGRVVSTRPTTTTVTPPAKSSIDRLRRPLSRTRSRHTTTTEAYAETAFEPTKPKYSGTTQKYNQAAQNYYRRPTIRNQRYRGRNIDRSTVQSETQNDQNIERHDTTGYEHVPTQESHLQPSASVTNSNLQDGYPSSTVNPVESYPSSPDSQILRETVVSSTTSLGTDAYSNDPNYSQSDHPPEREAKYQTDFQTSSFGQTGVERSPANGFNYQSQNEKTLFSSTPQSSGDYSYDSGRIEGLNFNVGSSTVNPNLLVSRHKSSQNYEAAAQQVQPDYDESLQNDFGRSQSEKTDFQTSSSIDLSVQPVYDHISQDKQEEYAVDQVAVTDVPLEVTTQVSTTEAPLTVRQRARGRAGGRVHQDPAIQVRPRGSQDEYVRFSPVNQDTGRSGGRQGTRIRPKVRTQQGSQVQTEGNEYVRIQAPTQYQKSTTTTTTTSTTTTTQVPKVELEYGFIRTPNFHPVHPIDRFQVPAVTFRPTLSQVQVQTAVPSDDVAVEVSPTQAQILKNRQKYHVMTRRPLTKTTTTTQSPPSTTTLRVSPVTSLPDSKVYTVRPKTRPEEPKPTRIRGKIRKPGRKRTTTTSTTESTLDSNNELPLDENYPRIVQASPKLLIGQQALYEENLEDSSPLTSLHGRPVQLQETENQNFPQQLNDFVINFGVVSGQGAPREEYDQTQLASSPSRKYSQSSRTKTHTSYLTSGDIEGAESQWSTKLTRTSFQPSYSPNHVGSAEESPKNVRREKSDDSPEIITAGPEVPSITVLVTSNDGDIDGNVSKITHTSTERQDIMLDDSADSSAPAGTENIGEYQISDSESDDKQKNVTAGGSMVENVFVEEEEEEDHASRLETTTIPALGDATMIFDREDDTIEVTNATESTEPSKKIPDPLTVRKSGQRRRRVRVRVRPTADDIATAESQHFSSAVNGLVRAGGSKYDYFRDSRSTTIKPVPPTSEEVTQKSILEDFLEEMLKSNDDTVSVRATSTTANFPGDVWTTTTTSDGQENSTHVPTTLQEDSIDSTENDKINNAEIFTTTAPTTLVKSREFVSRYHRTKTYHAVEEVEDLKVTRNKVTTLDSNDDGSLEDALKDERAESSSEHSEYHPQDNDMTMYRSSNVWMDVEPAQSSSKDQGFFEDQDPLENTAEGPQNEERLYAYTTERYDFRPKSRGNVVYHSSSAWRDVEPIENWSRFAENRIPSKNPTEDQQDEEQRESDPTRSRSRKMYSSSITRVHPTRTSSRFFEDQDSLENAEEDSIAQNVSAAEQKSHPKNHRTKWSEVKNLSNQSLLDYSKFAWDHKNKSSSLQRTSTSEPEIMTSTNDSRENGNSNVKILTDYVQAIFRSMKNDEGSKEKASFDSSNVTEVNEELAKVEKSKINSELNGSAMENRDGLTLEGTQVSEKSESESENDVTEAMMESSTSTSVTMSVSVSTGKVSTKNTEPSVDPEEIKTTTEMMRNKVESEASTTSSSSSSFTQSSEFDSTSSVPVPPDELTTQLPAIENSRPTRNSTGTNLGRILRTSTTTKVSHMTEICYRGRCVMTKPKKEVRVR